MQVTDDHLHGVERALKDGWNRRKLERLAGPVVEMFERARPGGRQPELVEFFESLVRVVSESGGNPCVALGAILWNETNVRPMITAPHPSLKREVLGREPQYIKLVQPTIYVAHLNKLADGLQPYFAQSFLSDRTFKTIGQALDKLI